MAILWDERKPLLQIHKHSLGAWGEPWGQFPCVTLETGWLNGGGVEWLLNKATPGGQARAQVPRSALWPVVTPFPRNWLWCRTPEQALPTVSNLQSFHWARGSGAKWGAKQSFNQTYPMTFAVHFVCVCSLMIPLDSEACPCSCGVCSPVWCIVSQAWWVQWRRWREYLWSDD